MNNAIYICIDRNYEKHATACFNSLNENYPNHPVVLVYANDLSDEFIKFVNSLSNFRIVKYKQFFIGETLGPVNNQIIYNKYRLWSSEFDEYDNILHLDADTLILKPLDEYFVDRFFVVTDGTENFCPKAFSNIDTKLNTLLKEDGISFNTDKRIPMVNAGAFCIPKKYRIREHLDYLFYLTKRYANYLAYADQTVITLWCCKNNIKSSKRLGLNYLPSFFGYTDTYRPLEGIRLVHFVDKKPDTINFLLWDYVPAFMSRELVRLYNKYLV